MVLTLEQKEIAGTVTQVCAAFSVLGSLFIMVCYINIRDFRTFAFTLVFWMAFSDFWGSLAKLLGDTGDNSPGLCAFQAIVSAFFEMGSVVWATLIAFTMHQAFLRRNPAFSSSEVVKFAKRYHAVTWAFCTLIAILPLTTHSYGDTGGWCWIKNNTDMDHAWRYICFYAWVWVAWGYSCYVYINVRAAMRDAPAHAADPAAVKAQRRVMRRIMLYPCVLVIAWAPASINRAYELFASDSVFFLTILHAIFQGLFGFFNAIVYGMTPAVNKRIRLKLATLCGKKVNDLDNLVDRENSALSVHQPAKPHEGAAADEDSSEEMEVELESGQTYK